ncbi:MAG TPA: alpha/beta hydrolase [Nannocystis sp.]|jgi:pimeloyl-ACP methyl ester carboxylesterase
MNTNRTQIYRTVVRGKPVRYQVHARADGGATPVLLVHGLGCSSRAFRPTLDLLTERGEPRRAFAPDMPGYGSTPGPRRAMDMEALGAWQLDFLDAIGIPRAHVIGNSMGCQVAMAMARQAPGRVASLILTGPTTGDQYQPLWRYVIGLLADSLFESWSYNISLARTYLQMGVVRHVETMRHLLRDHPIARASEVVCPTLIVRGKRDLIIPKAIAQRLAAALPRGEYAEVEGVAHAVQHDLPTALWALAEPFFARSTTDASAP